MKLLYKNLSSAALVVALAQSAAAANITIGDSNTANGATTEGGTGWYKGGSGSDSEYEEVEPGMNTGGAWDLVAFGYSNGDLQILSGYDLKDGYGGFAPGHIFIDLDGVGTRHIDPNGDFNPSEDNGDRYDYEVGITYDIGAGTYTAYRLSAGTTVYNNAYDGPNHNSASNPWRFDPTDGTTLITTGTLSFVDGTLTDAAATAIAGFAVADRGYLLTLNDLTWLNAEFANINTYDTTFLHFTMECGNDNLEGQRDGSWDVPDGGTTLALLGFAFTGLALVRRKQ